MSFILNIFIVSFIFYNIRKHLFYNFLSPVFFNFLTIVFSFFLVTNLYNLSNITDHVVYVFCSSITAYFIGSWFIFYNFSNDKLRNVLINVASNFNKSELYLIFFINFLFITMLCSLGLIYDGSGDSRQEFNRIFLPLQIISQGISQISIILLLSEKFSNKFKFRYLFSCVVLSIPFSGKSVFFSLLFLIGLQIFIKQIKINFTLLFLILTTFVTFFLIMSFFSYGVDDIEGVWDLFFIRLMMSGDVYIYAYQNDLLASLRSHYDPNFLLYLIHPITTIFGLRMYDRPLGAMLGSEATGDMLFTGPNPQTPVLVDFFFQNSLTFQFFISLIIGLFTFYPFRALMNIKIHNISKNKFSYLLITSAVVFLPLVGFIDFSRFLSGFISLFLSIIFLYISIFVIKWSSH